MQENAHKKIGSAKVCEQSNRKKYTLIYAKYIKSYSLSAKRYTKFAYIRKKQYFCSRKSVEQTNNL